MTRLMSWSIDYFDMNVGKWVLEFSLLKGFPRASIHPKTHDL
jgi:hypothetical protein